MCGIAGILTADGALDLSSPLQQMTQALSHRGPDFQSHIIRRANGLTIGLAHTRLSILDLSPAGRQPMATPDERCWLTYNGEVYNFQQLRSELPSTPGGGRSRTDTEVILDAYRAWNTASFPRLRGMFAFGLWDEDQQRLLLVRDPLGIKPLYFYRDQRTLLFASEVRALLRSGLVPRRLNQEGLESYLRYGSPAAPLTIIEGVEALLPGHYLSVRREDGTLRVEQCTYAADLFASPAEPAQSRADAVVQLRQILSDSVRLHLISDVPLGVFLSGGIDSSAVVALAQQASKEPCKTFSVVFSEKEFTEATHARTVAEEFGTDHCEILLSPDHLFQLLPEGLDALDQPSVDGFNTFVISKAVKEAGVTVALSGLGGDELFAGYASFQRALRVAPLRNVPQSLRRMTSLIGKTFLNGTPQRTKFWDLVGSDASPGAVYRISRRLFDDAEIARLAGAGAIFSASPDSVLPDDPINAISKLEFQGYMCNTLLRDTDAMSMAHALEVRVPFVDIEVARFVAALPGNWKMSPQGTPKPLLLDALQGLLPETVWRRPKMGFSLPFDPWMRSALRDTLEDTFRDKSRSSGAGLQHTESNAVWQRFLNADASGPWTRPWALFVLQKWCAAHGVQA